MTHDLITLSEEAPYMFLDEIQDWLAIVHDVKFFQSALWDNLQYCGLSYKMLRKAASERDDEARTHWKSEMQDHWIAKQVIFVDESSKDDRTILCRYGRALSGQRAVMNANFVRGNRYSLVAAMGVDGYIGTRIVLGSVDGDEFFDFIVNDVVSGRITQFDSNPSLVPY
jgi:hypothetical protein